VHSARFLTAADLILDLTRQETARALQHRLRSYLRPTLLAIDEVGYLAYDAHAADLLFQVVSQRRNCALRSSTSTNGRRSGSRSRSRNDN